MKRMRHPEVVVSVVVTFIAGIAHAQPITEAMVIERALQNNPEIAAATAGLEAAQGQLSAASRLVRNNPNLSGAVGPRFTGAGSELDVGVEVLQPIEIAGQRGARVEAADAGLLAARARLDQRRAEVGARARTLFAGVLAAEAKARAAQDAAEFSQRSLDAARDRFAAGAASQIDLNAALIDFGRAQRELLSARQRTLVARAELVALLGAGTPGEVQLKGQLEAMIEAPRPTDVRAEDVIRSALQRRPDVNAARAAVEAARSESRLANRSAFPTPSVGVGWQREEQSNIVQGLLSVDLPVFDRNQAERATATARARQAEIELSAVERRAAGEITLALQRLASAHSVVDAYRTGLNEAAEANVKLVQEGYRAGKLDLFQLLVIQRDALEARRGYIDALEELVAATAELDRAMGITPGGEPR